MTIEFVQVNARNVEETLTLLQGQKCVGFEIVNPFVIPALEINVDPQHGWGVFFGEKLETENKSAAKWVLEKIESIDPNYQTTYVLPSKLDLDCIMACALWLNAEEISQWDKTTQENWEKLQLLCDVVNRIDVVDCGLGNLQGNEWNPEHQKQQLITDVTWYQIISAFLADFKVPLEEKIEKVWFWLNDGNISPFEQWERQVRREKLAQTQSTITLDPVPLVVSEARGATGLLYSISPYGVCYNPSFPVKDGTVCKFTVCEFSAGKYLDLQGILDELNTLESGWGGNLNAGIIGSPFAGTSLKPDVVCEIVSRHVK